MADWSEFPAADDPWSAFPAAEGKSTPKQKGSGDWLTDVVNDGKENLQALANVVTHPVDTAKGAFDAFVLGPASKLANASGLVNAVTKDADPAITALNRDIEKQKAGFRERTTNALVDQVKEDFSDPVYTATHKPFTTAGYISTIAAPGALLPGRVGQASGTISRVTNLPGLALEGATAALRPVQSYARTASQVDHTGVSTRQALSNEFDVSLTRGQIAGEGSILSREDNLRYGREGQAQNVMRAFDDSQDTQIAAATDRLRQGLSGRQAPMTPNEIGDVLSGTYQSERQAARNRVSQLYDRAFDPNELAAAGVRADVPIESVYGLRNAIDTSFNHGPRPMAPPTPDLTPATYRAVQLINDFSQNGGIRSAFNHVTMPPAGAASGQPLVTGIAWQQMDILRKQLNGLRDAARTNPADLAGMRRILDTFDDQVGQMNPLLNQAREAHGMRVARFDPQRNNAAGVNNFLGAIGNDANPGKLIYDKLFNGSAIKNGTAGPMIQQLSEIVGHNPEALGAVREGMLNRLTTNLKTGEAYSPKISANNIRDALGGQSSSAYRMIFSPDELSQLGRYQELLDQIGTTRTSRNPSKTSYNVNPMLKSVRGAVLGDTIGHGVGAATGIPMAGPVGGAIGAGIGSGLDGVVSNVRDHRAALQAVSGQYVPPTMAPAVANGLAGATAGLRAGSEAAGGMLPPGILVQLLQERERKKR